VHYSLFRYSLLPIRHSPFAIRYSLYSRRVTSPPSPPAGSPTRAIALLAVAGFASQAMVRCADSLFPQIAADLGVTVGAASIIVWAYAIMHGSMQLVIGPIGDRFEKYRVIAVATALCAVVVMLCGFAGSLPALTAARIGSGACAAWIIPLGMAYIGDVTPYRRRPPGVGPRLLWANFGHP